jgi:hypothetical protein
MAAALSSLRVRVPAGAEELFAEMEARGWGDGLPVIPPTPERVAEFISASRRPASEVVGRIPPTFAAGTVEKIAVNAVLAGCRPDYMPVVIAALEAACQEGFNLYAIQSTTHPCGVLVLVSGEEGRRIGMSSGYSAFGPGGRANATIGRAVRMALMNIGGARPGVLDRSTQGSPARYTYCVAENDAASPWGPFHVGRGFARDDSVVTAIAGEPPHNINDHGSTTAAGLLATIAGAMTSAGHNNLVLGGDCYLFLGPEHAAQLAREGLSRAEVQRYIFDHAQVPRDRLGPEQLAFIEGYHEVASRELTRRALPLATRPEDINVLVVGGDGRHSCWVPTFGLTRSVSVAVRI